MIQPAALHLGRVPEPADWREQRIRPEVFTSTDYMRAEMDRLWPRVWTIAGRFDDIPRVGDYLTLELGNESIVVVRGTEDRANAFYNVCQHRGHQLVKPGVGHAGSFRCPFHLWTYALDGSLRSVPDIERYCPPLDKDKIALKPIQVEVWGGFVWVNLAPDAPPLVEYLGTVADELGAYHLEDFAVIDDLTIETACNWKMQAHAQLEFYHIQGIHRTALNYANGDALKFYLHGRHMQMIIPFGTPSPRNRYMRVKQGQERPEGRLAFERYLDSVQIDKSAITGVDAREPIQRYLRENGRALGLELDELSDDQLSDHFSYSIFPNVCFGMWANLYNMLRYRPHPTDPGKSFIDYQIGVRVPHGAPRPERPPLRNWPLDQSRDELIPVIGEDLLALELAQRNMGSRGFDGIRLFSEETLIQHFHDEIEKALQA